MKKKILVLCADRDDDVGRKTNFKGPIIGRGENVKLAMALGLSDPEESDMNAIFEAVKIYDQLIKTTDVEVATITGHKEEGLKADHEIVRQLDKVTEKFDPEGIIFVSDGASDEYVIPLLSSKARIISVRRVIVRQSERLEGIYFTMQNFIKNSLDNPRLARLVFGLPALALILFSVFDVMAWRFILGVLGAYLFIKGFQLEGLVGGMINEARLSLRSNKTAFFLYVVAIAIGVVGLFQGYEAVAKAGFDVWYKSAGMFVYNSVYIFFLAEVMVLIGWLIDHPQKYAQSITLIILGFSTTFVLYSVSEFLTLPQKGLTTVALSILLGFLVIVTTFALESRKRSK